MVEVLVTTYWDAKTERPEVTRALYRSVMELDNEPLIEAFSQRVDAATADMFASASGTAFANLSIVNLTLLATIFGTVRNLFERNLPADESSAVREQLISMCIAYLEAVRIPSDSIPVTTTVQANSAHELIGDTEHGDEVRG